MSGGKVRSKGEAHDLHETFNDYYLRVGRILGVRLAQKHGTVHSRMVREEMVRLGVLSDEPGQSVGETFFGPLFSGCRPQVFEKTGEMHSFEDTTRNMHHGREVCVWRLIPGAILTPWLVDVPTIPEGLHRARQPQPPPPPVAPEPPTSDPPAWIDRAELLKELKHLNRLSTMNGDKAMVAFPRLLARLESGETFAL